MILPSYDNGSLDNERTYLEKDTDLNSIIGIINAKLPPIAASLDVHNKSVGADFMELGKKLLSTHQAITDLINQSIKVQSIIKPDDDGDVTLDRIVSNSSSTVSSIIEQQNKLNDDLPRMTEITELLSSLLDESHALAWVAKRLGILKLYFRVESARNEDTENAYLDFQDQMGQLVETITSLRDVMQSDTEKASQLHKQAQENLQKELNKLLQFGDLSQRNLDFATNEVLRLTDRSKSSAVLFTECLKRIIGHVGQIVIAIQFHDIVRQQIEHVIEAFQQIISQQVDDEEGWLAYVTQLLRVQVGQLDQVIKSINSAHTSISKSFASINDEVGIMMDVIANRGQGSSDLEVSASFKNLTSVINDLKNVHQQTNELVHNIRKDEDTVVEMASRLTMHIEDMSIVNDEVKLNAINAIINSARLGADGETLGVLADQMMQLAMHSDGIMENTIEVIGNINNLAHHVSLLQDHSQDVDTFANNDELSNIVAETERLYDRFSNDCAKILSEAGEIRTTLPVIQKHSNFISLFGSDIKVQMMMLTELEQALIPLTSGLTLGSSIDMDLSRYTMSSERDIHLKIIGGAAATDDCDILQEIQEPIIVDKSPDDPDINPDNDDVLGDNIELF